MIIDNFIGIFENAYTQDMCDKYINYFNLREKDGLTYSRKNYINPKESHEVEDSSMNMLTQSFNDSEHYVSAKYLISDFIPKLFEIYYKQYYNHFSILKTYDKHTIIDYNIQKTKPGQGYHIWHTEFSNKMNRDRILAFCLYLNTVEEGGETEFLYLNKRIKPIKNTLLIWPTGFTHTHRGNPPLSKDKYILTGWIELGV